jgi:hypothetical protein
VAGQAEEATAMPAPASFSLVQDSWGKLVLTDAAGSRMEVVPVRGFPFSAPRQGILLCGAEGQEVHWIANLDDLPPEVGRVVEAELAQREFVPIILRVRQVTPRVEPSEWDVDTDRGQTRFVLNSPDDIRRLDERRAMVIDAHGIRYLILDLAVLDPGSRRILERYL